MRPSRVTVARSLHCRSTVGDAACARRARVPAMQDTQVASTERPRERLAAQGPAALTDAELVAVVLGTGIRGATRAGRRARRCSRVRRRCRDCIAAGARNRDARIRHRRAYAQLAAGVELARRAARGTLARGDALTSPDAVRDYLRLTLAALDARGVRRPVPRQPEPADRRRELFRGTLAQTSVYPREVVKAALALQCGGGHLRAQPSVAASPSRRAPTSS